MEPNPQQRKLIESSEGIYLVDAGAGTGKTLSLTRRYARILEKEGVEPKDVLFVTFTNNAADEMRKEAISLCESYSQSELREAPIRTFHSLCKRIIDNHGFEAPEILGVHDRITSNVRIMEDEILERGEFRRFMNKFIGENPQYRNFYRINYRHGDLLGLIKTLASKGVFPARSGWFSNGEQHLDGDYQEFKEIFDEVNEPRNEGRKQSELRSRLGGYDNKCYTPDAPDKTDVRGGRGIKQVAEELAELAFEEDRDELKSFVHDVYFEYIKYALNRNYLNFNFLMMFAFILLHEEDDLREELDYKYVMIDEFQDTSEIQFKLSLLLSKNGKICAVGDWKQSIYSFQYADVENIIKFKERLKRYKEELNSDRVRINYSVEDVEDFSLVKNYRSTQEILDFSEQSLTLPGAKREKIEEKEILERVTPLNAEDKTDGPTHIPAFSSESEKEAILEKILEVVGNPEYKIGDDDDLEVPSYGDILILTRTSKFGLKLQEKAREYGIPLIYEGGTEIFKTDPAIILLAWLRILDYEDSKRGWAVVLEEAGYNLDEAKHILKNEEYPENMLDFREELQACETVSAVARRVFDRYGVNNPFADKLIDMLQSTFDNSYMSTGRLIQYMEDSIELGNPFEVDNTREEDVAKVRTIHSEKGLEHPIVFISNLNRANFPSTGGRRPAVFFDETLGLRQKKIYRDEDIPYVYDNWRTEILTKCLSGKYDEERRLMYVAMTRAERHLFFTAHPERASAFFESLNIEPEEVEPELQGVEREETEVDELEIKEPETLAPIKRSVHSLMDVSPEEVGKGSEYGRKVHWFAEKYAEGEDVEPENTDEENVKELLDDLEGDFIAEETCLLPLKVGDRTVTLKGVIDLIHVQDGSVQLFDYKTDRSRENEREYVKQLSAYYHTLDEVFEDKEISANIFYSSEGEITPVDPLSLEKLKNIPKT